MRTLTTFGQGQVRDARRRQSFVIAVEQRTPRSTLRAVRPAVTAAHRLQRARGMHHLRSIVLAVCVAGAPACFPDPYTADPYLLVGSGVVDLDSSGSSLYYINSTGELWRYGEAIPLPTVPNMPSTTVALELPGASSSIAVGPWHACVGHGFGVSCWGAIGDRIVAATPVGGIGDADDLDAGEGFACAVGPRDEVLCWGDAKSGRLGRPGEVGLNAAAPVLTVDGDPLLGRQVSTGGASACAIDLVGGLWCWGQGWSGNGATRVTASGVTAVAVGASEVYWVNDDGTVSAQFGTGSAPIAIDVPPATALAVGDEHACAITTSRLVWCWGSNASKQLGRDTDSALPGLVGVGGAVAMTAGADHTCVRTDEGAIWCWGLDLRYLVGPP